MLSDSHGGALVADDATVVWATLPRFDDAPVMSAILDDRAGHWSLRPAGWQGPATGRRYLDDTMVLETRFETPSGTLAVTDVMPFARTADPHSLGAGAPHAVLRRARCVEGSVEVAMTYRPRPEFGLMVPLLRHHEHGVYSLGGSTALALSATVPVQVTDEACVTAEFRLDQEEAAWFALRREESYGETPEAWDQATMADWLEQTLDEWRAWSAEHHHYHGRWSDLVAVSGRVLQSLTYWPTGAIVAAPTTSLPEAVGGNRNWDYRFSWIRDTAMTIEALRVASCPKEAARFIDWIVRTAGGDIRTGQDLQIMYGIGGEHEVGERVMPHLRGWRDSTPVRVGNDAWHQRQLDVYGELLDAVYDVREHLDRLDASETRFLRDLADRACDLWREPDNGLWEVRGEPRQFVHSKLMCWVAQDRALKLADALDASEEQRQRWRDCAEDIRAAILEQGWDQERGAFTQTFDDAQLDASVLLLAIEGFLPADDHRMLATMEAIDRDLTDQHGMVYRYRGDDGLEGEEGTFVLCTFWLAHSLALAGKVDRAIEVFERAIRFANDVGLLAEEVDPHTGELLGNFPQAFSHIGLVNAAQAIARAEGVEPRADGAEAH